MLDSPGMTLLDGAVVHVGFDCLIAHGVQWRQAASDALVSLLGVPSPKPRNFWNLCRSTI